MAQNIGFNTEYECLFAKFLLFSVRSRVQGSFTLVFFAENVLVFANVSRETKNAQKQDDKRNYTLAGLRA